MKNEFLEKLEKRINTAKARNDETSVERAKELMKLEEEMISWVQKDFMKSIPPIIQTDTITVSSESLHVKRDGDLLNISINQSSVHFKTWAHVYAFLTGVASELSAIVERQVYIQQAEEIRLIFEDVPEFKVKFYFEYELKQDVEREEV